MPSFSCVKSGSTNLKCSYLTASGRVPCQQQQLQQRGAHVQRRGRRHDVIVKAYYHGAVAEEGLVQGLLKCLGRRATTQFQGSESCDADQHHQATAHNGKQGGGGTWSLSGYRLALLAQEQATGLLLFLVAHGAITQARGGGFAKFADVLLRGESTEGVTAQRVVECRFVAEEQLVWDARHMRTGSHGENHEESGNAHHGTKAGLKLSLCFLCRYEEV